MSVHSLDNLPFLLQLTALYYLGSSCPQTTYHIVSLALGFAVEHGMHRKSPSPPNAKDELEKRVFW